MAETVVGLSKLDARLNAISGMKVGSPILKRLALSTVREAKLLVPRRTGNLGRSIHVASVSATEAQVAASANYAAYVEYGTRAHDITPKAAPGAAGCGTGTHASPVGHWRRRHMRVLKAPQYRRNADGSCRTVWVQWAWVGEDNITRFVGHRQIL